MGLCSPGIWGWRGRRISPPVQIREMAACCDCRSAAATAVKRSSVSTSVASGDSLRKSLTYVSVHSRCAGPHKSHSAAADVGCGHNPDSYALRMALDSAVAPCCCVVFISRRITRSSRNRVCGRIYLPECFGIAERIFPPVIPSMRRAQTVQPVWPYQLAGPAVSLESQRQVL